LSVYEDIICRLFTLPNSKNVSRGQHIRTSTSTPGLSNVMGTMNIAPDLKRKFSELEKDTNCSEVYPVVRKSPRTSELCLGPHSNSPSVYTGKGILRSCTTPKLPKVKRELRFSVPHVTREKFYFPETPSPESANKPVFTYKCEADEESDNLNPSSIDRKRRSLTLKTGRLFKPKDKENIPTTNIAQPTYMSANFRSFRRPIKETSTKPNASPCASKLHSIHDITKTSLATEENITSLYSPLRLFRCNNCRSKFCESKELLTHVTQVNISPKLNNFIWLDEKNLLCIYKDWIINIIVCFFLLQVHKGIFSLLRPQYGCGVCAAKFYESKHLQRHCLQHHPSLLDQRRVVTTKEIKEILLPAFIQTRKQQITSL